MDAFRYIRRSISLDIINICAIIVIQLILGRRDSHEKLYCFIDFRACSDARIWSAGRETERARKLAEQASEVLAGAGPYWQETAAAVDAWLTKAGKP